MLTMEEEKSNLIINYLPSTLNDEDFRSMFASVGPVKSTRVMRDRNTGLSYGFGFVTYENIEDAHKAIETLNGLELQTKKIKVAFSRKEEKGTNLYIRGLPPDLSEDDVRHMCEKFGSIVNCRVLLNPSTGKGKGVAFVIYEKKSECENAIRGLNGMEFENHDKKLLVDFAEKYTTKLRSPNQPQHGQQGLLNAPYMPRPISPNYSPPNAQNYFGNYNSQAEYYANNRGGANFQQQNYNSRYSGGGGAGHPYFNQGAASYTNNTFNAPTAGAQTRPGMPPGVNATEEYVLFAYNIGLDATDHTLLELFSPYGAITKSKAVVDAATGQCKGYGFVTMIHFYDAQNAVASLNGHNFKGRMLQVSFKKRK